MRMLWCQRESVKQNVAHAIYTGASWKKQVMPCRNKRKRYGCMRGDALKGAGIAEVFGEGGGGELLTGSSFSGGREALLGKNGRQGKNDSIHNVMKTGSPRVLKTQQSPLGALPRDQGIKPSRQK